ncbi:hypothetical protein ACFLW6_03060 [Chloroflexota bacterium]
MKKLIGKEAIGKTSGASELCFSNELREWAHFDLPKRVVINDLTLREGRQLEGSVLSVDEVVHIARLLEELGVPMIQVGAFYQTNSRGSSWDYPYLQALGKAGLKIEMEAMGNHQQPPFTKKVILECLKRVLDSGLSFILCTALNDEIMDAVASASGGVIKGNKEALRDYEIDVGVTLCEYAKSQGRPMNVNLQDFMRCDFGFMERYIGALVDAGVNIVELDDIIAPAPPFVYQWTMNWVHKRFPKTRLGVHVHNDYGNALNAVLASMQGGAEVLHCGINGYGERAGHCDLGALVINLEYFYGIDTGINTEKLYEIATAIADIMKQPIPTAWPLTGSQAFSHIHDWHWQYPDRPTLLTCVQPEAVGGKPRPILGEYMGRWGIRNRTKDVGGIGDIPDNKWDDVVEMLRYEMMWRKRPLSDDEFRRAVLRALE